MDVNFQLGDVGDVCLGMSLECLEPNAEEISMLPPCFTEGMEMMLQVVHCISLLVKFAIGILIKCPSCYFYLVALCTIEIF